MHQIRRSRRKLRAVTAAATLALVLFACVAALVGHASISPAEPTQSHLGDCPTCPTPAPTPTRTAFVVPTGSTEEPENNLLVDEVVPAGGSMDVPLAFEGSSDPTIRVGSLTPGITASFDGVEFDMYSIPPGVTSLQSKPIANPKDGLVHISNPGVTQATVTVATLIYSTRHLTITPSDDFVAKGGAVSVDVQVSEATPDDGATAYLQDFPGVGVKTPILLAKVGTGHWTGQIAPTTSGKELINVRTSGARVRIDHALISVSTGNLTIGTGFTERLIDTDNDGLANSLELTVTVTAKQPARYGLSAHLVDSTGKEIDNTGADVSLVEGTQGLRIDFMGSPIFQSGISGPYRLVNVTLSSEADYSPIEASIADLGATQGYDYHVFQH